ncbi:PPC domain-containing protein [soil metagenome]
MNNRIPSRSLAPALGVALLLASLAQASTPSLNANAIQPTGAQRGTEVEVTLSGARLADAEEILWYQPGIEVTRIEPVEGRDNQVKATLKIDPEARLGLYEFRLRTATGISQLRTFTVGAYPEVAEVEPNNNFEDPQVIPLGVTVVGVAENEDEDFYVVEAKKGERISAEVEGIRLGISLFDPYVAILDERRFELARSDDAALVWQDGIVSILAPEDGKYIIQVRESAYQGNANCHYRLHIGNYPRPRATVPAGGPLGETVEVRWIGDIKGETTTTVSLPQEPDPYFGLQFEDEHGTAPHSNAFRLSSLGNVLEVEPNNTPDEATPFEPPTALNGVIEEEGDTDYYSFSAKKGQRYDIQVYARQLRSPLDSVIDVAKKGGGSVANNDDANGSPDSYLRFECPDDGEYVLSIRDHLNNGGPNYFYRIEVTPIEPKLTLSLPNESGRTETFTVAVPKGNRQAILVNALRADFGGALAIDAEGLPEGIDIEADTMAASIATMPALFTAVEDAEVGGTLARLTGQLTESDRQVPSEFRHTTELVLGQNNTPFWTRTVDAFAVAVAEEAPFSIEVVEPKVPIVRGGSMDLKVVATRAEGFDEEIAIRLPWNPPGIGSSISVKIPKGANEAVIPINATGNAPTETWKIVVNGTANGPTGPVMVSSQLAPLTISPPFLAMEYEAAAVEQGKETDLIVTVNKLLDFPGEAKVTLVGLPNQATTEELTINEETGELRFRIKTTEESPAGRHKNLFSKVVFTQHGEPIVHNIGAGELRIDKPLPPKPNAPPKPEVAEAKKDEPQKKPLSRLEQLRLEQAERAGATTETPGDDESSDEKD